MSSSCTLQQQYTVTEKKRSKKRANVYGHAIIMRARMMSCTCLEFHLRRLFPTHKNWSLYLSCVSVVFLPPLFPHQPASHPLSFSSTQNPTVRIDADSHQTHSLDYFYFSYSFLSLLLQCNGFVDFPCCSDEGKGKKF